MISRSTCRDCGSPLDTVLNLGDRAISTFPIDPTAPLPTAPLHLVQCVKPTCGLVQLAHTVAPESLFRQQYWYRSGINETMVAELTSIVQQALRYTPIKRGSVVLDLGANDGTLLAAYPEDVYRIAVEPSQTFTVDLMEVADETRIDFFPDDDLIAEFAGKVRAITTIACLYDVDDPHAFVDGIRRLLAPDGVWIVQVQDLAQMLAQTAFDTLCHEHLTYLSLRSIERLCAQHGLAVLHAERRAINGGSLRCVIGHHDRPVATTVQDCRKAEDGCHDWEALAKFSWRVTQAATQIRACLQATQAAGQIVDLYGASTKGNTLLQVVELGRGQIRQAWERSPAKWGRHTVTGIPIISEVTGREDPPDLLLCGIWQFREAVLQREAGYLSEAGHRIIFPLPEVDLVHLAGGLR